MPRELWCWDCSSGRTLRVLRILPLLRVSTSRATRSDFKSIKFDAACITGSQYTWIPPDWTAGDFAQKIEAQDDAKNLALTRNFTVAEEVSAATSIQGVRHS